MAGVLAFALLDLSLGSVSIPFGEVLSSLFGIDGPSPQWQNIVLFFRLPRMLTAILAGGGLAVSGLLMQTFFRNPLAGPFVLGISSGASLGVALLVLAGTSFILPFLSALPSIVSMAVAGSIAVLLIIMLVANKIKDSTSLLIVGLMFGSIASAIVGILQFFSNAKQIQGYLIWTFGSLGGISWADMPIFILLITSGLLFAFLLFKPLNVLILGEEYAQSMGINIKRAKNLILLVTGLLAGTVTALCGPIAFIGIAVPHLTRTFFSSQDHKLLIPAVAFVGAGLMILCDIISQMPWNEYVLPINAVTSVVGAPVVIWMILRKSELGKSFN